MSAVITEQYNVVVNRQELIGSTISDAVDGVSYKPMSL